MKMPVLHPEMVYGKRGIQEARYIVKELNRPDAPRSVVFQSYIQVGNMTAEELNGQRILWDTVKQSKKVFCVGKDFFTAISSAKNDVPVDLLPSAFSYYIACPFQDDLYIKIHETWGEFLPNRVVGFYVAGTLEKDMMNLLVSVHIADTTPARPDTLDAAPVGNLLTARLSIKDGKVQISKTTYDREETQTILYTVINLVAYINSSQPDIHWMRPKVGMGTRERKTFIAKGNYTSNDLSIPIRVVSWNWQRPPQYTKDEWIRKGHFRWQRFGPGLTQAKFIFIEETVARRRRGSDEE